MPGHRLLGERDAGWRQVTEQLAFERGGPERVLTTYPLLVEVLRAARDRTVAPELGRLMIDSSTSGRPDRAEQHWAELLGLRVLDGGEDLLWCG